MASSTGGMSSKVLGRIVGAFVLLHFVGALTLPYILLNQVVRSPDFLGSAAQNPGQLRASALLFLIAAAVTLAMSVVTYPVLRQSPRLALCLLALSISNVPLQLVESGMVLSMLSLGQRSLEVGPGEGAMLQVVAAAAYGARRWTHYMQLFTAVSWIFVFFAVLWRARLIPRVLAVAGLLTSALQLAGVPVSALLAYPVRTEAAMPLGPVYIGLGLWLLVKGFGETTPFRGLERDQS